MNMYYIKQRFDYLKMGRNIDKIWEKKIGKTKKPDFELVIIKNWGVKSWHLWAQKFSLY